MADLNLSTVELTSTLRTAPLNGAPSSSDFNEGQRETLVDLATIVSFINNQILPLINALPDTALQPPSAPVGIEGRTIWSDTSDQTNLFFDSLSSTPLTLAESMRVLNGMITNIRQQLTDVSVEVASLQARLASTNQNDIALALQNLSSALNQVTVNQQVQNTQITEIQGTKVITARSGTITVPAGTQTTITVSFATAFADNFYTVDCSLEMASGAADGLVDTAGFVKDGVGVGVTVGVINNDSIDRDVILHVMAQHD